MAETATKLPVKTEDKTPPSRGMWPSLDDLRHEIDRLFAEFHRGSWLRPTGNGGGREIARDEWSFAVPAVDVVEKDTGFELTAELPGMAAKDIDVAMKDGAIVIKGEKQAGREERSEGYYRRERQYGAFERSFAVPEMVDTSAIEARFANGILTVTLPKTAEARKPARKIDVKAA